MRRLATIVALSVAVLLGGAGPALAHNVLINSDPAEGARLDVGPKQIRLSFDQPVRAEFNALNVVGPGGTFWTDGAAQILDNTITAPVRELGPAGTYTVGYRILSNDGHPVSGKVTFTLAKPGNGTPAPPPQGSGDSADQSAADSDAMPIWPWIAAAVVLVALGLVLALRLGKPADKR